MEQLLTRDEFRQAVLERDNFKCVRCLDYATAVHHIMERKLWSDEGYYFNNGVSLCDKCHILAEQTVVTCSELRRLANISAIHLPFHLYEEYEYDKWGNIILSGDVRVPGEMFYEEQVQKSLKSANLLGRFTTKIKHPRTNHFPWSENLKNDDRMLQSLDGFIGEEIIATVKLDGEQTSMYLDYMHVRSLEYQHHDSRSVVRQLYGNIRFDIPKGWRICGENMYAKHSIKYENLDSYFYVHSIWNEKNECLAWDDLVDWCNLLGLIHVPVLFRGIWEENTIKSLFSDIYGGDPLEGYVVRAARKFSYSEYPKCVGKFVRKNHVQTDEHWMSQAIEVNGLRKEL